MTDPLALAVEALTELVTLVRGECPSLLNEDSGGNANLAMQIDDVIDARNTRAAPVPPVVSEEVVERVARAIYHTLCPKAPFLLDYDAISRFDEGDNPFRSAARAALGAMAGVGEDKQEEGT